MKNFIYLIIILTTFTTNVEAQSLHFSQNAMAPLITNPAYAGLFNGDIRVGGIYRTQWSSISNSNFKTTSISADTKILPGVTDGDWISGGVTFYNDRAGTVSIINNSLMFTGAYNLNLYGEGKNFISIGASLGINTQRLDLSNAQFDSQYSDGIFDASLTTNENINANTFVSPTVSVGGMYYHIKGMRDYYFAGLSLGQFAGVKKTRVSETETNSIPIKLGVQLGMSKKLNDYLDLVPRMFLFKEGTAFKTDLLIGGRYVFLENSRKQILNAFTFSAGIRFNGNNASDSGISRTDAFILQAGLEVEKITASIAYDANISDLKVATGRNGAVEIALSYNISYRENRRGKTGGSVNCPRF